MNVNSADASQLALLPRVGPSVAQRIIDYRKQNGPFKKAEDLMLVQGIGEKTFQLIKPYVATAGETTLKEKVKAEPLRLAPNRTDPARGTAGARAAGSAPRPAPALPEALCHDNAQKGFQLVELIVALAVLASLADPRGAAAAADSSGDLRLQLAAGGAGRSPAARPARFAVRHDANVAVKFRTAEDGAVTFTLYRDGDGDGVLNRDIDAGVDPRSAAAAPGPDLGRGFGFGFPPGPAPRGPRLAASAWTGWTTRSASISRTSPRSAPLGTATPGSAYVTDGVSRLAVVRSLNRTGRVRVLTYDSEAEVWRE